MVRNGVGPHAAINDNGRPQRDGRHRPKGQMIVLATRSSGTANVLASPFLGSGTCALLPAIPSGSPGSGEPSVQRWRKNSEFGPGRRVPLDREQRAVFRAKLTFKCFRRVGALTIAAVRVAEILVAMQGKDGRLDPCIETLATRAGVDPSTVVRALARLRECGFVTWVRRLVRDGSRVEQTSNAYVLAVPGTDLRFAQAAKPILVSSV